jgi:uncharacterized protein Usg
MQQAQNWPDGARILPDFLLQDGELAARLPDDFTILDYFHGRIDQPKPAIIQRLAAKRQPRNF